MAAIFGFINHHGNAREKLESMAESLRHRGTDQPEYISSEHASIAVRGARKKLPGTQSPCAYRSDKGINVVLDGRIINSASLLERVSTDTHNGNTAGDAELIARLYTAHGDSIFQHLRGGFAIAVHDVANKRLILARDHLGHKPVYFADTANGLFFASEVKALLAAGAIPFEIDAQALSHFLSLRFIPAPHSLVKGVNKLAPAHFAVYQDNNISQQRYWHLSFASKSSRNLNDVVDELQDKMYDAISAYIPDTGVSGAFLSGGLDSGLIVANMSHALEKPFDTFSLGVDNDSDEVPIARLVSSKYNTNQHESYPKDDVVRLLPEMIWNLDEPSDMVLVSKYLLSRMAAPHIDTVLSGDGGDELFAGFMRYLGLRDAQYYKHVPAWFRTHMVIPMARLFGGRSGLKGMAGKILWISEITNAGELPERYAEAVEYLRFRKTDKQKLFTGDYWKLVSSVESRRILTDLVRSSDAEDPVEKLLHTDFLTRLPEHLLMLDDRTGASHNIDVLCPLADRELVEYVTTIPADMKIRGRQGKFIERKLAERMLPSEAVNLQKTGWSFPFAELCAGPLQPFLRSVFTDSRLVKDGIFQQETINRIISEHGSGKIDHHIRLWMLLSLEIWYIMTADNLHYDDMSTWMDTHLSSTA